MEKKDNNQNRLEKIINSKSVNFKIMHQMCFIRKILSALTMRESKYIPDTIILSVSTYIFQSPLSFLQPIYYLNTLNILKINHKYLLKMKTSEQNKVRIKSKNLSCIRQSNQSSSFITILKEWKPIIISTQNCNEIIIKGKHFLNFLKNVIIEDQLKNQIIKDEQNGVDLMHFQKNMKQKKKYHRLICQEYHLNRQKIKDIRNYEKDKKLNSLIITSFRELMKQNIIIFKIEENYYSQNLEQPHYYIQMQDSENQQKNKSLKSSHLGFYLVCQRGNWILKNGQDCQYQIYDEYKKPYKRIRQELITQKLLRFTQNDIWLQ